MKKFNLLFLALLLTANNCVAMNSAKRSCNELDNTETPAEEATRKRASTGKCQICLDEIKSSDQVKNLRYCTHTFHRACAQPWLNSKGNCPLCRSYNNKPLRIELSEEDSFFTTIIESAAAFKTVQLGLLASYLLMRSKKIITNSETMKKSLASARRLLDAAEDQLPNNNLIAQAEELLDEVADTMEDEVLHPLRSEFATIRRLDTTSSTTPEEDRINRLKQSVTILQQIDIDLNDLTNRINQAETLLKQALATR